jgi:hypothetical protein
MQVNRSSTELYSTSLKGLTNEELHKEIWALDEHISYMFFINEDASRLREFLRIAKEEKETRMVAQGYQ